MLDNCVWKSRMGVAAAIAVPSHLHKMDCVLASLNSKWLVFDLLDLYPNKQQPYPMPRGDPR